MIESKVARLDKFIAPYGREVTLENVDYENDTRVLRIRIREGNRFTVMDINPETAERWGGIMIEWASEAD
ncbi:MAG: hypothetical protein OQJ84_11830 [Xanthomonadales bacterium]|nr:hypothetical protein [Xanthomonadales bacterium]